MMTNYCFAAPILPGGEEKIKDWIKNRVTNNPDHDRVYREAGITREQVWIQRTPQGDFAVVCYDTKDPQRAFEVLARSKDPWAVQFRDFLMQAHGFDLTKPMELNKQLSDWGVSEKVSSYNK
jgi:hypothetical protein